MTSTSACRSLTTPACTEQQQQSLKRRPSSPLDCQSLQSSLKRVRLSCSPGELRLQRDLRSLREWDQVSQECWKHSSFEAYLSLEDPLRLILHSHQARFWVQIPRMYPHRPPTIARVEGVAGIRHIVVQDAPHPSSCMPPPDCGTTLIYHWSPVMHLESLLDYLLQQSNPHHHNHHQQTTSIPTAEQARGFPSAKATTPSGQNSSLLFSSFVEEHKMEDQNNTAAGRQHSYFSPNRFDIGYGKYKDLLTPTTAVHPCSSNAMDTNE